MNYIDIALIGFAVLGLILGIIGRAQKKIFSLIFTVLAILIAYFGCGKVIDVVGGMDASSLSFLGAQSGQNVMQALEAKVGELLNGMPIPAESIMGLVQGVIKLLIFWIMAIVLMLVLNLIGGLVVTIVVGANRRRKKKQGKKVRHNTAIRTLGIFSAVKLVLIFSVLLCPIVALSPIVGDIGSLVGDNEIVTMASEQISGSKYISFCDSLLTKTKPNFMVYEVKNSDGTTKECYLYDDIKTVQSLLKVAGMFIGGEGIDMDNPLASISKLSDDDIRDLFTNLGNSDLAKDMLSSVVEEMDLPFEINVDEIDLAAEADTFIAIKNIVEIDEESGEMNIKELNEEDIEDLAGTLANSGIVAIIAESNEGMFADMDDETVSGIEDKLGSMVSDGELTQDKMDNLMKLFRSSSPAE